MKQIFVTLGLFLIVVTTWAEEDVFSHPLGPQTMGDFTITSNRLSEHPIVKGNFEQEKTLSHINRSLNSSGNFIIAADMGMVWETLRPFPSTIVLGKDYIVQSRPDGQKTVLSAQGNETFIRLAEVISAVFSGNTQGLLNNFAVYYIGTPENWELGLIPRNSAIAAFAVRIKIKGDSAIRSILINEQNNDTIIYILSNHSYPTELTIHEKNFFTLP